MEILQRAKVQHEIEHYIKRVLQEKNCNMKRWVLHKKVQHGMVQYEKSATWKEWNIQKVQHEKMYKLPQWNSEKVHKNSILYCTNG